MIRKSPDGLRRAIIILLAAAAVSMPAIRCARRRPQSTTDVSDALRSLFTPRLEASPEISRLHLRSWLTPRFYELRGFRPAWLNDQRLTPQAREFLAALSEAGLEGLDPCDYGWDQARALVFQADRDGLAPQPLPPDFLAGLDAVLTDAFFRYASHLVAGKVNPEIGLVDWNSTRVDEGLAGLLEESLASMNLRGVLLALRPQHDYYLTLRDALADARTQLSRLSRFDIRREDPRLAGRAARTNPIAREREALERRIATISVNMERWRWLPRFLGRRFILVDTASYRLLVGDDGRVPMSMKVVVGNLNWPTPFLHADITGFTLNPSWNCTTNIFYKEIINYIKADKNYLPSNKMVILQGWGRAEHELDPATMDWSAVNPATYPQLHLRQLPGSLNILGRLKFNMPNPQDIYLHDTPYQEDFKQNERVFSHGCIRAEKPFDLAAFLARSSVWTKEAMLATLSDDVERTVDFTEPVPIYVNYFTAWPGTKGVLEFRRDVYGRDERLAATLHERLVNSR